MKPVTSAVAPSARLLRLADGRRLAYSDRGIRTATPVLGHGMPGCHREGTFFHERARHHGFRILTPDRPGIGASDARPGQTLRDYPDDLRQLLDHLGIDRFSHIGWSSGGSRTLACALVLADRLDLGVCLSGYTHFAEYPGRPAADRGHPLAGAATGPAQPHTGTTGGDAGGRPVPVAIRACTCVRRAIW